MFERRVKLFRLLGFEVHIDLSWLILAVLITWTLAKGFFPYYFEDFSTATYWWMGVAGMVGLFFSIVFHELSHSLVARRYGLPMKGITLFIFGGVAEMDEEPPSPKAEFFMAIAGPISSLLIAGLLYGTFLLGEAGEWPKPINGVLYYLAFLNGLLAAFNLIPGFPLDGGRVLRSALWHWKKNLRWSTRIASEIGRGFGAVLIILGVLHLLGGNFIGGIWWALIGLFLRSASQMSYEQLLRRKALEGEKVDRFMKKDPITVPSSVSLERFVEDYIYRYHHRMFPVVENGRLVGCTTVQQVKEIPREQWNQRTVRELANQSPNQNTIQAKADAIQALSMMKKTGNSRLMVMDEDRLVGVVTLKDMLDFLSLKLDLEGEE